jgi:hypothetical protein
MENIDRTRKIIALTGGTLSEILNMSTFDIEPAESIEADTDMESPPHWSLWLFFTTDYFDLS